MLGVQREHAQGAAGLVQNRGLLGACLCFLRAREAVPEPCEPTSVHSLREQLAALDEVSAIAAPYPQWMIGFQNQPRLD